VLLKELGPLLQHLGAVFPAERVDWRKVLNPVPRSAGVDNEATAGQVVLVTVCLVHHRVRR